MNKKKKIKVESQALDIYYIYLKKKQKVRAN